MVSEARPRIVKLGVPYVAVPWFLLMAFTVLWRGGPPSAVDVIAGLLVAMVWGVLVSRAWQGRPVALSLLSLLAVLGGGGLLIFGLIIPAVFGAVIAPGMFADAASFLLIGMAVMHWLALMVGVRLQKAEVRAWSEARHPVRAEQGRAAAGPEDEPDSAKPDR